MNWPSVVNRGAHTAGRSMCEDARQAVTALKRPASVWHPLDDFSPTGPRVTVVSIFVSAYSDT